MGSQSKRPDIERITNRYVEAWEYFERDVFSVDELENELLRANDPEDVPSSDKINNDLYRVSTLGLVEWFGEGEYQVAIAPEAGEQEWEELMNNQIAWIRSEVESRIEDRTKKTAKSEDRLSDSPEIIEYDGEKYLSAFVGPKSEVEGQARYYQAALSPDNHDGVVLRAYQDVADSAENLAEKISNDEKMSETVCVYRFDVHEMEMADVKDHLEYRVYLNETKLL